MLYKDDEDSLLDPKTRVVSYRSLVSRCLKWIEMRTVKAKLLDIHAYFAFIVALLLVSSIVFMHLGNRDVPSDSKDSVNHHDTAVILINQVDYVPHKRKAVVLCPESDEHSKIYPGWEVTTLPSGPTDRLNATLGSYLTWIINNYRDMPDHVVFLIEAELKTAFPDKTATDLLENIDLNEIARRRHMKLSCAASASYCEKKSAVIAAGGNTPKEASLRHCIKAIHSMIFHSSPLNTWAYMQPGLVNKSGIQLPRVFASHAGSSIALSKAAIWAKPLFYWVRIREVMLMSSPELEKAWASVDDTAVVAFDQSVVEEVYARLWHYLLGADPVSCVEESICGSIMFGGPSTSAFNSGASTRDPIRGQ